MPPLPSHLVNAADQAMAHADLTTANMVEALRYDLADGPDLAGMWWMLANSFVCCPPEHIAAGFASTLIALAQQPSKTPKDFAVSAPQAEPYPESAKAVPLPDFLGNPATAPAQITASVDTASLEAFVHRIIDERLNALVQMIGGQSG